MIAFEEAVAAAKAAADPGEDVGDFGFRGKAEWIVLTVPVGIGLWCAYVDQETGEARWASETDPAYADEELVGNWPPAERAMFTRIADDDPEALTAAVYGHAEFCLHPLHPGPCKHVFDQPKSKKRRKPALTGHFTFNRSKWWEQVTEDDDEGSPVKDLTVRFGGHGEYTVANGTVFRVDGVAYLVEHDEGEQSTRNAHEAVRAVFEFHRARIAKVDEGYQQAYFIAERPSPNEAGRHASGDLPLDRHIAGSAGDGSAMIWGYTMPYFRPADIDPIMSHEYGHNVAFGSPRVTDPATGAVNRIDESPQWESAGRTDAGRGGPTSRVSGAQIDPNNDAARHFFGSFNAGVMPGRPYPIGVTPYGTTSMREDFAESVLIYLAGPVATGFPMRGVDALTDVEVPIYFRDLFPARAAELDKLFPGVAQQQVDQISRERSAG